MRARESNANLVVMAYPEERPEITETVGFNAPCDVLYATGGASALDLRTLTIGVGGGPHQRALLDIADGLGGNGTSVRLVNVTPTGGGGSEEDSGVTLSALSSVESVAVHNVTADSVAEGPSRRRPRLVASC